MEHVALFLGSGARTGYDPGSHRLSEVMGEQESRGKKREGGWLMVIDRWLLMVIDRRFDGD